MANTFQHGHVLHARRHDHQYDYVWGGGVLEVAKAEKDGVVIIATDLKPSAQCAMELKRQTWSLDS